MTTKEFLTKLEYNEFDSFGDVYYAWSAVTDKKDYLLPPPQKVVLRANFLSHMLDCDYCYQSEHKLDNLISTDIYHHKCEVGRELLEEILYNG